MMGNKKSGVIAAAAAVASGTAIGVTALVGGTAHAQATATISITGLTQAGSSGNPAPDVLVSVTCPAGAEGQVSATVTQGVFYDGRSAEFVCTGSPQNETAEEVAITGSTGFISAGPASAGASLWIGGEPSSQYVGTTATVTYP
jgi:hypothetical protein